MVQSASSGSGHRRFTAETVAPPADAGGGSKDPVKKEILLEDELEEEYGPLNKRMKQLPFSDQFIAGNELLPMAPSQYNPLNEPSPLGLRLKKSPSLLELIQMRLSQGNTCSLGSVSTENSNLAEGAVTGSSSSISSTDKLKASNFPASLLRIGRWEYASKNEGDLVAKCYFAKHKLVWEVLDGGLKSKIEVQWSDIMGLNGKLPEDGPATMTIVLARQPLFYRETNPQPRKHTLWQVSPDFTDGQASMHRQHFLQIPLGVLNKHFEKLIQCDPRLNFLSRQPEMVLDSPYFESFPPGLKVDATNFSTFTDGPASSSITSEPENLARSKNLLHQAPSPSSVMDAQATEWSVSSDTESLAAHKKWEQLLVQGLRPSMSKSDLVNHIGGCVSGQGSFENPSFAEQGSEPRKILEDIAQHLLGDSQVTCSDEKSLMKRVNSLCCLLQKDGAPVQLNADAGFLGSEDQKDPYLYSSVTESTAAVNIAGSEGDSKELSSRKPAMPRIDSYGEILLNLPRVASLPKFLFEISEEN